MMRYKSGDRCRTCHSVHGDSKALARVIKFHTKERGTKNADSDETHYEQ